MVLARVQQNSNYLGQLTQNEQVQNFHGDCQRVKFSYYNNRYWIYELMYSVSAKLKSFNLLTEYTFEGSGEWWLN